MHFDDRLATVLRHPAEGATIARIQYRQLLDLLGALPANAISLQIDQAFSRLEMLSTKIPAGERAKILSEPMMRLRNARLIACLAAHEPSVASAAITASSLGEGEWLGLIPELPIRARGILRHRRGMGARIEALLERLGINDWALPAGVGQYAVSGDETAAELILDQPLPDSEPEPHGDTPPGEAVGPGISSLLKRIEEFRKGKSEEAISRHPHSADAPRLPLGDNLDQASRNISSFDFSLGPDGRIVWADADVAPMCTGMLLVTSTEDLPLTTSEKMVRLFRGRQPISGEMVRIEGAPAITGEWQIDAAPSFDQLTGRFLGYHGRMRRPQPLAANQDAFDSKKAEADRIRQMLHELRTPTNAIQMSAEVIQQQLYGPTPHEYRALAASIAGDTARILAGFDELDRLVRLDSGALEIERGSSDLADVASRTVATLQARTDPNQGGFRLSIDDAPLLTDMDESELERLLWRLLAGIASAADSAEFMDLQCSQQADKIVMSIALPAQLADLSDSELIHAQIVEQQKFLSAGMFGLGFTLRLAMAETQAAGGALTRMHATLKLELPASESMKSTANFG